MLTVLLWKGETLGTGDWGLGIGDEMEKWNFQPLTFDRQTPITNYQLPITHYPLPITHYPTTQIVHLVEERLSVRREFLPTLHQPSQRKQWEEYCGRYK
ncbi:hypothetical protein NIES2107_54630 [Nostoc carneum NIES-2107]|nr:hypothetical protein NIES2107_54630 [Nostoc carneum NIES-2107]